MQKFSVSIEYPKYYRREIEAENKEAAITEAFRLEDSDPNGAEEIEGERSLSTVQVYDEAKKEWLFV